MRFIYIVKPVIKYRKLIITVCRENLDFSVYFVQSTWVHIDFLCENTTTMNEFQWVILSSSLFI